MPERDDQKVQHEVRGGMVAPPYAPGVVEAATDIELLLIRNGFYSSNCRHETNIAAELFASIIDQYVRPGELRAALEEFMECHKGGGFVEVDATVIERGRKALAGKGE